MLCNSKIINRPDKLLNNSLISLAYSLVMLTISVVLFLIYPVYFIYLLGLIILSTSICLLLTIKTLNAAEEAISYGGFANEILKNEFNAKRIDNYANEAIIENEPAIELMKSAPVIQFLEKNLTNNDLNKTAFYRLQTACKNLQSEKVILSLHIENPNSKLFNQDEWFEVSVRPIYLKKTNIFEGPFSIKKIQKETYFYWNLKNITAEKNMEKVFKKEKKSLHDFLDYLPVGLYVTNKNNIIEYVNDELANSLNLPHSEIIGKSFLNLLSANSDVPEKTSLWKGIVHLKGKNNKNIENYLLQTSYRDDEEIKIKGVLISGLPAETELKTDLNNAFDKISWLFNFAPVGIIFTDNEGNIKDCNGKASDFIGQSKSTLIKDSIFNYVKTDDLDDLKKEFTNISQNRYLTSYIDLHIKDNKDDKIALTYLSPMKKFYASDISTIDGVVIYLIDATKQKSLELQFAQAQKMQAVGQLAGGVAHDFNNLLTAMIGFCDLLLQRHGIGDPSFADLIQIKQNANRAAGLVRQLLAFSRKQPLKPKLIDTTENFVELSHMLKRILGEQIFLNFYHGMELGFIKVDPVQFSQVIINLAVNAKDAMNGQGTLSITTRTEILTEKYQFGDDTIKPGEFVAIDVTDTGCGIPPEILSRIFDPFFSTKQNIVGSGTGLGLAMVYGIVRQTEGFIKVDSKQNIGTTFSIYLPRFETLENDDIKLVQQSSIKNQNGSEVLKVQETIQRPASISEKLLLGMNITKFERNTEINIKDAQNIRIMFVEDEDSVRAFALRALKKKGYDVIGCNCAENALEHLKTDSKFNLLITDMVMPGLSGAELTKLVKEQISDIKVILASGYSEEIVRQELSNFNDFEFITKPFSLGDLTKKVFDVLNTTSNGENN